MKASTFKVLVQLVLNASKMVYRYQKGFNLQMHYYDMFLSEKLFFCKSLILREQMQQKANK